MKNDNIQELIRKFNGNEADAEDIRKIEQLLESGEIGLDQLTETHRLEQRLMDMKFPTPPRALDDRFYRMLAMEKRSGSRFSWRQLFSLPEAGPRLALASVMLIIGLAAGYLLRPSASAGSDGQMAQLTSEVSELKEMMMLSLLERESPTDRLKAVGLSRDIGQASAKVTAALLQTLNNDDNINVRLAALDALKPYAHESSVREALIRSIAKQQSPLVQVALAELMVQLQAKASVTELQKILRSDSTPGDVKKKIRESIKVLI